MPAATDALREVIFYWFHSSHSADGVSLQKSKLTKIKTLMRSGILMQTKILTETKTLTAIKMATASQIVRRTATASQMTKSM